MGRTRTRIVRSGERLTRIKIGGWTVTPTLNRLERDGASTKLEPRAMDLLVYLANARGRVVPADELLREVWQGRVFDDGIVYKRINQLRKALGDDAHGTRFIETIPKRGYRLVAAVARLTESDDPSAADAMTPVRSSGSLRLAQLPQGAASSIGVSSRAREATPHVGKPPIY